MIAFAQESDKKENAGTDRNERRQDLDREMTLEREYDPIVQDAAKVITLPVVREMNITKRPIVYSDYAIPMIPEKDIIILPAGTLMTDVEHVKRNGYLHFGGGMHTNLMGDVGYHILNTAKDNLSVYFSHRSTNGNVKFEDATMYKRKAKFNDNIGGLDFKHNFERATLKLGGKFGHSSFNYYGLPTNMSILSTPVSYDSLTNQGNRLINVYAGVASSIASAVGYHFDVEYTNFNQKYSLSKDLDGMTENHIGLGFGLNSPVIDGRCFGVDVKANILTYAEPSLLNNILPDSAVFSTHFSGIINPYYRIGNDSWKLILGLNLMFVSQYEDIDVLASPNILFETPFSNWNVFYANLGGGIESNSMAELSRTNRYINPAFTADASKTWADLKIGVRSNASAGLWFDIYAGYKYTESDVFYNPSSYPWINDGFNNVSMPFQPTTQRIQAGASLKYDFRKVVDFYLKGEYNHYILKYVDSWKNVYSGGLNEYSDMKSYGKPSFTANAGINVRPVKPLTLNLDYCMMSGLHAYVYGENVKMKTINDLRFRGSWKFNDMFGAYLQFNNLLFQKQELYYGYPLQPFSAMAGLSVNF